ncbi:MAG: AmmeMemoRadiSam system radical SAM enzyme [Planctomyces sp.]|nr:AmmeMemoRadiSam system radical SAM enzyme [Planctomyces sp.]
MRRVDLPPTAVPEADGNLKAGWWHETVEASRIVCDLCPRECSLKPGDRGFCFVRQNIGGEMMLTTFGKSTGFCIDPIEKKPLNHFYPGTSVLSFGTAGCNLGCKFCQNWDISKSREVERLSDLALPETIVEAAIRTGCRSVAFTYNDPIVWAEYAIETAKDCRAAGVRTVAVTAGYISKEARPVFFQHMDAANVDLKAFTEDFYQKVTYSHLEPVLNTLKWLKHESDVWFEITNLVIPGENDTADELRRMCDWILESVGPDVPVHFSAFHPDFRMMEYPRTPPETLLMARQTALEAGIRYAYVGNVNDVRNQSTWCPGCGELLIERNWYQLGVWGMDGNRCRKCHHLIPGHFDRTPGNWGAQRMPLRISEFSRDQRTQKHGVSEVNQEQAVERSLRITPEQKTAIHSAACEIVAATVEKREVHLSDPSLAGAADLDVMGVFVTLKRNRQLRGCIGSMRESMPLLTALKQSAVKTAVEDLRFPAVSASELPYLTLDVSVLFNFEEVRETGEARVGAIEVGKHGIRIVHGNKSGLLLPVVAVEQKWDSRTFLDFVCRKAGLPLTAWRDPGSVLFRFQGLLIDGGFRHEAIRAGSLSRRFRLNDTQLQWLAEFARANIIAGSSGAVPLLFPRDFPDTAVDGVGLQVLIPELRGPLIFSRVELRGGVPLQMCLLELTRIVADLLKRHQVSSKTVHQISVRVVEFADPAMHGTFSDADLRGIDPRQRALGLLDGRSLDWSFDPECSPTELLQKVAQQRDRTGSSNIQVVSFAAQAGDAGITQRDVSHDSNDRAAALAGRFYPESRELLERELDECFRQEGEVATAVWPAVMVPHAGLKYSGRIAAQTLSRVQIPESVIIICPKHTPYGAKWACAPCDRWALPGGFVNSDRRLAEALVQGIDGLVFDAEAHAQEHAIEVELPLLRRLSPASKVVGIAIGDANLAECLQIGRQLAVVIAEMVPRPLLIISSDMNHFASDAENRQLDEIALNAMESLDPSELYSTVTRRNISMCGLRPAVIVMEALRSMNQLGAVVRTGYATSASVTQDTRRVVGYAGMLLGETGNQ